MHVPVEVAGRRRERWSAPPGADGCVAVGGGSAVGLGKAIALEHGLPRARRPHHVRGLGDDPGLGAHRAGVKRTGRDLAGAARRVVYDPDLTLGLPVELAVTSGINAIAHAVEALYAPDGSPLVALMAAEGGRARWSPALPAASPTTPTTPTPAAGARTAPGCAGAVLGATTMSLHHKLCHALGGTLGLRTPRPTPCVLPHVLAYNLHPGTRPHALLAEAIGDDRPGTALWDVLTARGLMRSLADLGMPHEGVDLVVERASAEPSANPWDVSAADVRALITAAWEGRAPAASPAR